MKPHDASHVHRRRSIRLTEYDYRQPGAYFVTICTQAREFLFGDVMDGKVRLNDAGRMVEEVWRQLPDHYPGVEVDVFAVMPNHVHGVILLVGDDAEGGQERVGAAPCGCPGGSC